MIKFEGIILEEKRYIITDRSTKKFKKKIKFYKTDFACAIRCNSTERVLRSSVGERISSRLPIIYA